MARENSPSRDARRRGKNASTLNSETPPRPSVPLGDIIDLYAYVAKIARSLTSDEDEFEDLLSEGVTLACERAKRLAPGESASSALAFWLESRLRDERRKRHPEWRRNSRGGTAYSLQVPTGLAWEQDTTTVSMPARADGELIQSRISLELVQRREDLHDPRIIGRLRGVPSAAAIATGQTAEIWATIEEERQHTAAAPFQFVKSNEL